MKQAQELSPEDPNVLANLVVLSTIQGKESAEARKALEDVRKEHELLVDFAAKEEEFAKACEKYSPKFEA